SSTDGESNARAAAGVVGVGDSSPRAPCADRARDPEPRTACAREATPDAPAIARVPVANPSPRRPRVAPLRARGTELGPGPPRLSVRLGVPLAHVAYDGGRDVRGVGDVELAAKMRLAGCGCGCGEWIVSAGAAVAAPTGRAADGLGSGHVELAPFVAAAIRPI